MESDDGLATVHPLPLDSLAHGGRAEAVPSKRPLKLNQLERAVVSRLIKGDATALIAHVSDRATALAAEDGDIVRRRSLAKAFAICEAQMQQLGVALADAVSRRDESAAFMLDRVLRSATKRLTMLSDELRAEIAGGRRNAVFVGAVHQVTVNGR